ncbi:HAUS augmin-like complex subunit 3 [Notechis scutatus]|uniref:HAUS augmin-like complex subunit 3 n=1 Tax=Notechis scutatus TaxID=8663 RepID=A0A6J1VWF4_9SAUR|nr:HAUS augmin-like complex subunit 3 [Notechis scutatus]XP_026547412.1 HAUS augmin-like complex subunit 3 [Notechis scutatus]XP_026547421.1 HAUS augmin-like complex subunit 3 [Notechis scutatus]
MDGGARFVEILKRTGYFKANSLNGEDFDWLFETLENKSFLEWFCTALNEHNVLSEEELQAFNALQKSSKPILGEEALNEVLKISKPLDLNTNNCEEEEETLKMLENEFQALKKITQIKIHRRNKLQIMASGNSFLSLKVKERGEEELKMLKDGQGNFTAMNIKINNELQTLTEGVKKLASFFAAGQDLDSHPVLLTQLPLYNYLYQEEQSTGALTSYTKKQFFQGISELVESSNEENFQLVHISESSNYEGSSDICDERSELARLQMAYICAQHQLIQQQAKNLSMRSGLQWAEKNISTLKKIHGKENFEAKISSLNNDIAKIKIDLSQINSGTLPSLIKENAELLNMPVVKGDFDLQIARQDYYISRQDQICNQLIKQKASFEFLQLAYEIEFRKLRENSRLLENTVQDLKLSNDVLVRTIETMSEPSTALQRTPRNTVEPKNIAAHRMCQLLEGRNPKQLFRTYERLEEMAEKLHLDSVSVLDQLVLAGQEQNHLLSKMDADLTILHDSIYCKGESVCLSNQQLSEQSQQLEFQLNKINQLITDFLADIKAKKDILENNKVQEMERKLCVFFFNDEERLKNIVETLEQRVQAQPNL